MTIQDYDNELLHMAHDLAVRLLPAFENTRTGIPYPRVGRLASRSPASGCGGRTEAEGLWGGGEAVSLNVTLVAFNQLVSTGTFCVLDIQRRSRFNPSP